MIAHISHDEIMQILKARLKELIGPHGDGVYSFEVLHDGDVIEDVEQVTFVFEADPE